MANIGMMEGAYFVSRTELISWLNTTLKLNYTKVEQVCTGSAYCQLMDFLHPGQVQLSKVNFNAKLEYEYIKNFKVLQTVFTKLGIERRIEVDKLVKGKYQDNLEFLQWFKAYFDRNIPANLEYDPVARRAGAGASEPAASAPAPAQERKPIAKSASAPTAAASKKAPEAPVPKKTLSRNASAGGVSTGGQRDGLSKEGGVPKEIQDELTEMRLTIDGLERERDFYYGKLRQIEIMCQDNEHLNIPILKNVLSILYAVDEDAGDGQ